MELLKLKTLLSEKGMTGKDLADKVGVTPASISNIVQNNSFPKPDLLLKIAEVLNLDVGELFNPTKNKQQDPVYIKRNDKFIQIGNINLQLDD